MRNLQEMTGKYSIFNIQNYFHKKMGQPLKKIQMLKICVLLYPLWIITSFNLKNAPQKQGKSKISILRVHLGLRVY